MAGAAGEEPADLGGLVGVVEDQQPARGRGATPQRLAGGLGRLGDRVADPQAEPAGELGQCGGHQFGLLGVDPPDQVVVGHEAVRVLQRDLCLADAAEPVQRLRRRQDGGHAAAQLVAQLLQHGGAAGERGVARRHVPDLRLAAGESRPGAGGLLQRPVAAPEGAQQALHGLRFVAADQVHRVAVAERRGQPDVADPDRHQLTPGAGRVGADHRLPQGAGLRRPEVGGREHRDGPVRGVDAALGLVARVGAGAQVARQDAEPGPAEDGLDPVGPHPVLGHVAEVEVGGHGRAPAGERVHVPQPDLLVDRRQRGDPALGEHAGEPLAGGQHRGGGAALVAEGGEDLLVGVERPVRDLHRAPVVG